MKAIYFFAVVVAVALAEEYCGLTCSTFCDNFLPFSNNTDLSHARDFLFDIGGDNPTKASGFWYRFRGDNSLIKFSTGGSTTSSDQLLFIARECPTDPDAAFTNPLAFSRSTDISYPAQIQMVAETMHVYFIFAGAIWSESQTGPSGKIAITASTVTPASWSNCSLAEEIDFDQGEISGTISGAIGSAASCHEGENVIGHWYHGHAPGKYVRATTCFEDNTIEAKIDVYDSCDGECADNDEHACATGGSVLFPAGEDGDFYLFVYADTEFGGDYKLKVDLLDSVTPGGTCENPVSVSSIPFSALGNTADTQDVKSTCLDTYMHGIWYHYTATETAKYLISTCQNDDDNEEYGDTIVEAYEGCPSIDPDGQCLAYSDDFCGRHSAVYAELERDHEYYFYVTGYNMHSEGVKFRFNVTKIPSNQKNDQCLYAYEIPDFPASVQGNTADMKGATTLFSCSSEEPKPRSGAWFRYTATGDDYINVSTCADNNALQADIEVFRNCQGICTAFAQYVKGEKCTSLTFGTHHDETYSFFITPTEGAPDAVFNLTITSNPPTENGTCAKAIEVDSSKLPFHVKTSTYGGEESYSSCEGVYVQGLWIHFVGTGNKMIATTCGDETNFDTKLELYDACPEEGSSEHCLKENNDYELCTTRSLLEIDSDEGKDYWIFARGHDTETGIVEVRIYDAISPPNGLCTGAIEMKIGETKNGVIEYADISGGTCSSSMDLRGGWYTFIGNGRHIEADSCGEGTNFESRVDVYTKCNENGKGESCYAQSSPDVCTSGSSVSFNAKKGVKYYVYVAGNAHGSEVEGKYFKIHLFEVNNGSSGTKGGLGAVGTILVILVVLFACALIGFAVFYIIQRMKNKGNGAGSYKSADDIDGVPIANDDTAQEEIPDDKELSAPSEKASGEATL